MTPQQEIDIKRRAKTGEIVLLKHIDEMMKTPPEA